MREALSETLSSAIRHADAQARQLNQEFVGAEHLLLGIIANGDGSAMKALKAATDIQPLKDSLLKSLPHATQPPLITGRLPLSPKAQQIINTAIASAQAAGDASVSTRFVLQALLEEPQSTIVTALRASGADIEHLARLLAQRPADPEK